MAQLPPDLSRVGDELVAAAARALDARRRRRVLAVRAAVVGVAGLLAFTALGPARLGSGQVADPSSPALAASGSAIPAGCDRPRGARFSLPSCAAVLTAARTAEAALPHGTSLWHE